MSALPRIKDQSFEIKQTALPEARRRGWRERVFIHPQSRSNSTRPGSRRIMGWLRTLPQSAPAALPSYEDMLDIQRQLSSSIYATTEELSLRSCAFMMYWSHDTLACGGPHGTNFGLIRRSTFSPASVDCVERNAFISNTRLQVANGKSGLAYGCRYEGVECQGTLLGRRPP